MLISGQHIHDPVHHQLHLRRQVAVDLFPSDRPQAPRQGLYLIFQLRVLQGPIPHLPDQLLHGLRGILLQLVAVRCLLLIDMHQVLLEDPPGEGGLHLPDAVRSEVALFGIGGEDHHVDMDALLFFMEGGVPPQVIRMDLVAFGDVAKAGVYQGAPVLRVVVAQPLRVLPADRHHWRPDVAGMLRHLPHRLGQILHLAAAGPESMLSPQFHAGAVGHVVQVVLPLAHGHRKVLSSLSDELRRGLLRLVFQIVLILQ